MRNRVRVSQQAAIDELYARTGQRPESGAVADRQTSGTLIDPSVTFIGSPVTAGPSGKILVLGAISGTDATASEIVSAGGTAIGDAMADESGPVGGGFAFTVPWMDTVAPGTAHTYGIHASATHALSVGSAHAQIVAVPL